MSKYSTPKATLSKIMDKKMAQGMKNGKPAMKMVKKGKKK